MTVRFDKEIHDQVSAEATKDRRSFNAEVNELLQEALEARRRRDKK